MSTYFMHHRQGTHLIPDEDGYEFADLEQMRQEAIMAARELIAFAAYQGRNALDECFEVKSETGKHLFTLVFKDALQSTD